MYKVWLACKCCFTQEKVIELIDMVQNDSRMTIENDIQHYESTTARTNETPFDMRVYTL